MNKKQKNKLSLDELDEKLVDVEELAYWFYVSPRTIQHYVEKGMPRCGQGKYPLVRCAQWHDDYLLYEPVLVNIDNFYLRKEFLKLDEKEQAEWELEKLIPERTKYENR